MIGAEGGTVEDPTKPLTFAQLPPERQAAIRQNLAKMHAAGAPDADIESYLTQHEHLAPTTASAPALDTRTLANHGASGTWGDADNADTSTMGNVSRAMLQGATLGAGNKLVAAGNAVVDKLHGDNFGDAYAQRLAAERAASHQFGEQHPVANLGLEAAGGLGSMIASGGASAPQELATVGKLARAGKAAMTGLDLGAASGAVNADGDITDRAMGAIKGGAIGAVGGAVLSPIADVAGYVGNKLRIPEGASWLAQRASQLFPDASSAQRALQTVARATGQRGEAASEIGNRLQMDTKAGGPVSPAPSGVPTLALNRGGANVEGLAKGVVRRPGAGGAMIKSAINDQQAQMRPSVTQAFDDATGTNVADGERLIQQLADERSRIANTSTVAKAVERDARGAKASTTQPDALDAWQSETGGSAQSGMQQLRQLVADQSAEAKQLYGAARQATAGQPMQSETLDQIRQTPAGKTAYSWALAQKANRNSSLATVPGKEIVPAEMSAAEWATAQERTRARGMPVPSMGRGPDEQVPDPETLHYMKQGLAKIARLGMHDGAQGTIATQAQGALQQWGAIRNEMPEVWQQADAAFAKKARTIDAFNAGRNILRTQSNPAGTARQAVAKSLDAVEQAHAAASPEEQQALRAGAQSAITEYFRAGGSRTAFARQLQDPASAMSRRIILATGDAQSPQRLATGLAPHVNPQQLLASPPVPSLSPTSQAASKGLDVLRYGTSAPSNAPERSLTMLARSAAGMGPAEQQGLQTGAAQALRGEWAGASGSVKSPGRVFDFASPERAEQMSYAFPTSGGQGRFQQHVAGWDALTARAQRVLGGSDTQANFAEQAARDKSTGSVVTQLLHGRPVRALGALAGGANAEATSASRQRLDEEIARILTSNDPHALDVAMSSAQFRQRIQSVLTRGLGGGVVEYRNQP